MKNHKNVYLDSFDIQKILNEYFLENSDAELTRLYQEIEYRLSTEKLYLKNIVLEKSYGIAYFQKFVHLIRGKLPSNHFCNTLLEEICRAIKGLKIEELEKTGELNNYYSVAERSYNAFELEVLTIIEKKENELKDGNLIKISVLEILQLLKIKTVYLNKYAGSITKVLKDKNYTNKILKQTNIDPITNKTYSTRNRYWIKD